MTTADDLLFAAADQILADLQTPARQSLSSAAAVAGGPVKTTRLDTGECPTPGSGAALTKAATESAGSVVDPSAGAISGRGGETASAGPRPVQPPAGQPPLSGGDFLLPPIPTVPSFDNGYQPRVTKS